ncbi:hypothetical protein D6D60_04965 [Moraxella catarrhalis]|uniref:hypothetical protein n=1 Tax=Moraxella catarrhalis TaxID=480 RepID=UPI000EA97299|nr:hypothetical protein [Moraxella catarrhalis]RKM33708.1 hypothetical protein D6D60_04965 [Moraxella catarrhalis]
MTKIKQQRYHHELSSIALISNLWQNTHTTKLKAVKPSRHPLAIFTPTVSDNSATGVNISSLHDTDSITSYGGLIGVNTRPKGNSPSRLLAVVETCHSIFGWRKLTKLKGNPQMNHLLFTLTRLSPAQSFAIGVVMAFSIIGVISTAIVIVLAIAGGAL